VADQDKQARQDRDAEERSAPSGKVVYKAILKEGEEELARPSAALFWSGLAAGLSMGASLITEGLLRSHLPEAVWQSLVVKLGYCVGYLCVVLGRQQLFTENTLTPILPLLQRRDAATFWNVLRLWTVVLLANLLGGLAVAFVLTKTSVLGPSVRTAFLEIGRESAGHPFGDVVLRGIFAGWLIALMVWLLPFAESARVWVIVIITYVVGLGNFTHVIAGSIEVFALAAVGEVSWADVFSGYVVPSFLGNVLGGVTLVAALNHAQVVAGSEGDGL
jgi:formate/nitrite transporter FocA (FNT family)